ncbi:hypothetical protein FGM00_11910 [Aggregatimonas sangjinii]|uniref:MFS transporter n=1 Tax=Aggregatimonas sangjinii TaxID=2583587 RepID=A0A5B7SUV6_9FLAO|nr:DUF6326 family protein [Aggregatimonas sangjinii]QCX00778.1 hypothetical protein FGM00_11910 [Aggregatimonas sangjinii]
MDVKIKLSTLWTVVMLNLIFADVLSIFVELVQGNTLGDIIGEVQTMMAIGAALSNIPILMIYFSRALQHRLNRFLNMGAAIITLIFVIGGGSLTPHYIICATIEVLALLLILTTAWKWVELEL